VTACAAGWAANIQQPLLLLLLLQTLLLPTMQTLLLLQQQLPPLRELSRLLPRQQGISQHEGACGLHQQLSSVSWAAATAAAAAAAAVNSPLHFTSLLAAQSLAAWLSCRVL
jgi:hypothetical protein